MTSHSHIFSALIVDDSNISRRIIRNILHNNFNVGLIDEAEDGKDALKLIKLRMGYDLVFIDIDMPRLNGIEFLTELKELQLHKEHRVFIVTSHSDSDLVKTLILFDIQAFIKKPFTKDSFVTKIKQSI